MFWGYIFCSLKWKKKYFSIFLKYPLGILGFFVNLIILISMFIN